MARHLTRFLTLNFLRSHHYLKMKTFPQVLPKVRLYGSTATTAVGRKHESEAPAYKKMDHEFKISRKVTIQALVELLNIKPFEAIEIVLNKPSFRHVWKALLRQNHSLYVDSGVHRETLLKYPELLTITDLEWRVKKVQKLPYNVDEVAMLFLLTPKKFAKFIRAELSVDQSEGKIVKLSTLLEISLQQACAYITQKSFLCELSTKKIERTIQTLIEFGVSTENICNDLWVLKYSEELIRARLSLARDLHVDTVKTWMVRAKQEVFQIHVQRSCDNKSILRDSSLAEYLSERLECNVEFANYIILRQPVLENKSVKKLKELIDFLYAEGFKSHHICRVPKILVHSVETTRKRLKQFEEKGIKIDSLSILTKSQNQFMQYYEALVKSKNKSKSNT